MLEETLLLALASRGGPPTRRPSPADWDAIAAFCRATYMPYAVRPLDRRSLPNATMVSQSLGRITVSRFSYGTGVFLKNFDPEAGNILVLNGLAGAIRHAGDGADVSTGASESYVVDCSRTDYWLEADPQHMQFNLTIPHDVMAAVGGTWFGRIPDDRLWTHRQKIGGPGSRWAALLNYVGRVVEDGIAPSSALARHLEETLCIDLLQAWMAAAGVSLSGPAQGAAPYYVKHAEQILEAEARQAPTIGDVARRVGVSARSLSAGFRRFRGQTPREFLADRRLEGLRAEIERNGAGRTLTDIATAWGFSNKGALAAAYRARFGELPSQTRARARLRAGLDSLPEADTFFPNRADSRPRRPLTSATQYCQGGRDGRAEGKL